MGGSPMKSHRFSRLVCLSLLAALVLVPAALFASDIAIQDSDTGNCFLVDTPGLHTVQVVHRVTTGARAVRFTIKPEPGMNMSYVSETHPFSYLGNVQDGIAVCYGGCVTGNTVVATITYMGYGTTIAPCSLLRVVPAGLSAGGAETLDVMGCDGIEEVATGTHLEVRPVGSSGCNYCAAGAQPSTFAGSPHFFTCSGLPIESSTWGMIKSLYR